MPHTGQILSSLSKAAVHQQRTEPEADDSQLPMVTMFHMIQQAESEDTLASCHHMYGDHLLEHAIGSPHLGESLLLVPQQAL